MAELQGLITPSLGQFRVTLVGKRVQFWLRWSSGSVEPPGIDRLTFWNCIPGKILYPNPIPVTHDPSLDFILLLLTELWKWIIRVWLDCTEKSYDTFINDYKLKIDISMKELFTIKPVTHIQKRTKVQLWFHPNYEDCACSEMDLKTIIRNIHWSDN